MHRFHPVAAILVLSGLTSALSAADKSGPETIAKGLDNPTGVALQPGSGDVFVAERPGIVRFRVGKDGSAKRTVEINNFPTDKYGKGPIYDIGPLGITFANERFLIVADGSQVDTDEVIRIYRLESDPPSQPIPADSAVKTLGPLGNTADLKAEGNYYGVVYLNRTVYATANGDDTKGWIVRSVQGSDGIPQSLERFLATKEAVQVDAPVAITVNKEGQLVVGQMGEINVPGDSLLSIYDAKSGELKANYETGLNDITGLAYASDGKLYATDFAWMDTSKGALYTLTIAGEKCTAKKVCDLDKPTALAFDGSGDLYVTVFGTAADGSKDKPGQLLRLSKAALSGATGD